MRVGYPSICKGYLAAKEYVGLVVPGDEVLFTKDPPETLSLGVIRRWRICGFENGQIKLSPLVLAYEGLERFLETSDIDESEEYLVRGLIEKRYRPSVNVLFSTYKPVIVRRDDLGRPRLQSKAGLPVSWNVK